ncbi:MAG: Na(+)-translocating NADH-quinone reductase subunit A [Planctomycetota bacterium]|nr:Na(+)-translocating NADH-quinone reductase subunit A [Planctomycetaceae bacterium]MDQ3331619.1 Na(+)-translocating NADH-quinone reductase subunit A [Planctomycetota bacterium]
MTTSTLSTTNGRVVRLHKGLDLPIAGVPRQDVIEDKPVRTVALVADDYVGMKPTMEIAEGDAVKAGQLIFSDKKIPGVRFTSPVAGKVIAINRAEKRRFVSLVVQADGDEQATFKSYADRDLTGLGREEVRDHLLASGLWPALRTRPYGKTAAPQAAPRSIFVTAMDTSPLAADPKPIIKQRGDEFVYGLQVLRHLTDGAVYLCCDENANLPGADLEGVAVKEFSGPHPAGLPGTHIHFVDPVSDKKRVWYINYQDVIAIGAFFVTGQPANDRVISLAGPVVSNPRLVRTSLGASLDELTAGELNETASRVISGSVLSGRWAKGAQAFLGRYALQVSAVKEGDQREFLGWQTPGFDKYSIRRIFASALSPGRPFNFTTTTGGSERSMVPIGVYEDVMPLDILPTFLLRSLIIGDNEQAQQLGALELEEEDVALCTFVDPGKVDWGPVLRQRLTQIEKEG